MQYDEAGSPLAALVSVARRHGLDLTTEALRASYVDLPGQMPTGTLTAIARDAGLEARCIRPKWRDLTRLANILPAIVRLKDGGAAVLVSVTNNPQVGPMVVLG